MAKITLCSAGAGITDELFSVDMDNPDHIEVFIRLVQNGGRASGLPKPTVTVESDENFQDIGEHNRWAFDKTKL